MSEVSTPESGGLQGDLEGLLGRLPAANGHAGGDQAAAPEPPEERAAPVVVLLPRMEPRRRQRPVWVVPGAVAAGVAVLAGGAFALGRSTSSTPAPAAAPAVEAPGPTPAPATSTPATSTPATSAPATTAAPAGSGSAASPAGAAPATALEPRSALFAGGKVYLRGTVPDEATARTIIERAGSVVGPANVVDEYVVDPAAPVVDRAPLQVADTVQFGPASAVVAPEFRGLLDLGVSLLRQYPRVEVTVVGHTDAEGPDAYNQELSQRRVDGVVAYLVAQGVDPSRVIGVAKGEAEPVAANDTPEGRRQNRRIEFVIIGLLD